MEYSELKTEAIRVLNLSVKYNTKEQLQGILSGLELAMEAIVSSESLNEAYKLVLHAVRDTDSALKNINKKEQ